MTLEKAILQWDKKSAHDITRVYHEFYQSSDFIRQLLKLAQDEKAQDGATWLIKHWLENNEAAHHQQVNPVLDILDKLHLWPAKLHVLQSLPFLEIKQEQTKALESFLYQHLTDKNKFVKAWAYNGYHVLALQHPHYRKIAKEYLEMGLRDEAASIKARIRNALASAPL